MSNNIKMQYGGYEFDPQPIPFMRVEKQFVKTPDDLNIGMLINVTLEGTVVATSTNDNGIVTVADYMDQIRTAFFEDGRVFAAMCSGPDGDTIFFSGNPRVKSLSFERSDDNWVYTAPYTIELEFDDISPWENGQNAESFGSLYLKEASETWNVEQGTESSFFNFRLGTNAEDLYDNGPNIFRLEHNVSAVGKSHYTKAGNTNAGEIKKSAIQNAKEWVVSRLLPVETDGADIKAYLMQTGVYNNLSALSKYYVLNHVRTVTEDIKEARYTVNETWVGISGSSATLSKAIENYNVNVVRGTSDDLTRVTIEGNIQGLEERNWGNLTTNFSIDSSKYANASGYWNAVASADKIFKRAELFSKSEINTHNTWVGASFSRNLNPTPVNQTVGHNPANGIITYNYEFNDRPILCFSSAAKAVQESIVISDTSQADVIAKLTVLGRAAGPILQDLGTKTEATRTLTIDLVVPPANICPLDATYFQDWIDRSPADAVDVFVVAMENNLSSNSQVFKTSDTSNWDGSNGRYNRTVTWTYLPSCG